MVTPVHWTRKCKGGAIRLLNVNNLKLRRFKELFPSPAKTDAIDARRITELVRLKDVLPRDKEILQEVSVVPKNHQMLKRLTRRSVNW